MDQLEIEISGRVQGVNYRTSLEKMARNLRLKGFVKTRDENTIEVIAQGEKDSLEELLRWCQRGNMFSKITGMAFNFTEAEETSEKYKDFSIKTDNGLIKDKFEGIKNLGKRVSKKVIGKSDITNKPKHVVIIPDGNRRWAREKNWHPWVGHVAVTKNQDKLMELFKAAGKLGIEYLTFWAFSTENWKRDGKEVNVLFNLMRNFYTFFKAKAQVHKIKFRHIGRLDRLPDDIVDKLKDLEESTKKNTGLNIQFAMDYGGRDEIIRAMHKIIEDKVEVGRLDEKLITSYLDTGADIPDADMVIRTGGEKRTSGMMIWQAHYAEMYFTNVLFPDFDAEQLEMAVLDYSQRIRRFGGDNKKDLNTIDKDKLTDPEEKELSKLAFS
jgi:undecaprenyl diphosphate synthase